MPICQEKTYTFAPGNPTLINATLYDGNSTNYDWTIDEGSALNTNQNDGELGTFPLTWLFTILNSL